MTLLDLDITKRSDAARRSSRRAELKLQQELKKAGGLEDEMRFQLSSLKREQITLQKELHTLKFESRMSKRRASDGLTSRSSEEFYSMYDEKNLLSRRRSSDYGKNFFGYLSTPGSKKIIKKSTRELEKSLDDYCKKIDELMHEENIGRKLEHQQEQNKSVQDKLDLWMGKNSSRKREYSVDFGYQRGIFETGETDDFDEQKSITTNGIENDIKMLEIQTSRPPTSSSSSSTSNKSVILPPIQQDGFEPKPEKVRDNQNKKLTSAKSNFKETANKSETLNLKRPSLELFFDADLYAPDGRMRMAHRMPEFHLAFEQARKARYVRTREKRDFEIQLSVNEIFDNPASRRQSKPKSSTNKKRTLVYISGHESQD